MVNPKPPNPNNPYMKKNTSSSTKRGGTSTNNNEQPKKKRRLKNIHDGSNKAAGTQAHYSTSLSIYNKYASEYGLKQWDNLTVDYLEKEYDVEDLLAQYAQYLLESNYAPNTATRYLSGVKEQLKKRFKNLKKFNNLFHPHNKNGNPRWYSEIYTTLEKGKVKEKMASGERLLNQADLVSRKNVSDSSKALLTLNDNKRTIQSTQLVILWSSLGRSAELSLASWNDINFDGREIDTHWKEQKNLSVNPMRYPKDRWDFAVCPLHSLGRYLIVFDGDFCMSHEENSVFWLFPDLKRESEKYISNMLTNLLKWLKSEGLVDGLPPNPRIHGVRRGGTTELANNPNVSYVDWCARGAWDQNLLNSLEISKEDRESAEMTSALPKNALRYITLMAMVSVAGLYLHGYTNIKQSPLAPSTSAFMTEENKQQVDFLINALFCSNDCEFLREKGHLRELAHCLLACQLMHLREMELCCKPPEKNKVAEKIIHQARHIGIKKQTLYEWGSKVYNVWIAEVDKATNLDGGRDVLEKATNVINRQVEDSKLVAQLLVKVEDLTFSFKNFERSNDERISALEKKAEAMQQDLAEIKQDTKEMKSILLSLIENDCEREDDTTATATTAATSSSKTSTTTATATSSSSKTSTTTATASFFKSTPKPKKPVGISKLIKSKKDRDDSHNFNYGKPNKMSVSQFVSRCHIYGINLELEQPFSFHYDTRPKCRLLKLWRYWYKYVSNKFPEDVELIKSMQVKGEIQMINEQKLRGVVQRVSKEFVKKIYDDFYVIQPPKKGIPKYVSARDSQVGSVVSKIEDLEKDNRSKTYAEQDQFYIY